MTRLSKAELTPEALARLNSRWLGALGHDWETFAHPHQNPPPGEWTTWLLLGGRGAGKTRAGAEWVKRLALADAKQSPIALIGETEHDAREVMVEGVSGLLRAHERGERPLWIPSRRRLEWPNGAVAQVFSAEELSLLECPAFALTLLHALWTGHEAGIGGFANLSALLMTYFGARFGVLGVYVTGRTREKQAGATGQLPPSLIGELLKAVVKSNKK